MKTTSSKKFSVGLIPVTLILSVITLGFILLVTRIAEPTSINKITTIQAEQSHPAINSVDDLDGASRELDSNDLGKMDQDLKSLSSDTYAL